MSSLKSKIESLLFITTKPLSSKRLADLTKFKTREVEEAAKELAEEYNQKDKGIQLVKSGSSYQMVTQPDNSKLVKDLVKEEITGELTRPQLEALTIVAYRGPVTKPELEQIRGVNCSLILRNLMIRGLVESKEDKKKMQVCYNVTMDFMRHLGINDILELPDYEKLNGSEILEKLLSGETESKNR